MPPSGWTPEDRVIIAHPARLSDWNEVSAVLRFCEGCDTAVLVTHPTHEKLKQDGVHLVCHSCVAKWASA